MGGKDLISKKWERVVPRPKSAILEERVIALGAEWVLAEAENVGAIQEEWLREFRLSKEPQDKKIQLSLHQMDQEAYRIKIAEDELTVTAGSKEGLKYALSTLKQISADGFIPVGEIEDSPSLKIRGFHLNFDSYRQMDIDEAKYIIKNASSLKLNTVLIEYSNRFPFERHSSIKAPSSLTREEVTELITMAQEYDLRVIPLQQSIGHLDYLLQNDNYASVREEENYKDQLCPTNPDSFRIFTELAEEMIQLHPGIKYFHIGGDEARRLGSCARCRDKVEKYGVSRLYVDYINKVSQWLTSQGITPIIWDDMLCAHPEAIDNLDRNIVIMYWDYWTTSRESPYFIARSNRNGQPVTIYDEKWDSLWQGELGDLERNIMDTFATGVPLEESLGKQFLSVYGSYLGDDFPKRIKGYPYLEFFMDKGFKVIGAPTALGNGDNYHSLPNYWRFIPNIKTISERCQEAGAEGVITTAWYNYMPLMFHLGLGATTQFTWGLK